MHTTVKGPRTHLRHETEESVKFVKSDPGEVREVRGLQMLDSDDTAKTVVADPREGPEVRGLRGSLKSEQLGLL